jgi:hypothetical protein
MERARRETCMGTKRNKIIVGLKGYIPQTINFSELKKMENSDNQAVEADWGDEGLQMEKLEVGMEFEELIVQMLYNLKGNERIIFLYQLLREFGYQIDHGSFAKTLKMNRQKYMEILGTIRLKTYLVTYGHRQSCVTNK